jgi:drug/metabolite transporter (DMT)-like permease
VSARIAPAPVPADRIRADRTRADRPSATGGDAAGVALVAAGATGYGVTIVLGRVLADDGVPPAVALGIRFALAAAILVGVAAARRSPLLPPPGERLRIFLLGAIGYATESTLFYMALERGTAASAALLFYAYPIMVAVAELAMGWARLRPRLLVALVISATGTVLVVASGDELGISSGGMLCALAAAAAFGAYLLACSRLVHRSDPVARAAWVAAGASAGSLVRGLATSGLVSPAGHWPVLLAYGVATAVAFSCMFAGLSRLGASRTAVVMTLEAFVAVTLAAAFLGEGLAVPQLVGGAAIVGAAVLIGRGDRPVAPKAQFPHPTVENP